MTTTLTTAKRTSSLATTSTTTTTTTTTAKTTSTQAKEETSKKVYFRVLNLAGYERMYETSRTAECETFCLQNPRCYFFFIIGNVQLFSN